MTDHAASQDNPSSSRVPRIHIVGKKNSGKTTLVCELVQELTKQGRRVATVKHTHHQHELDTPGKDSHKHREAGAAAVGILSAEMTAMFVPLKRPDDESLRYASLEAAFSDCDFILVEGDLNTSAPKIEVWRAANTDAPYASERNDISAVITDDNLDGLRTCPRSDINAIIDLLEELT